MLEADVPRLPKRAMLARDTSTTDPAACAGNGAIARTVISGAGGRLIGGKARGGRRAYRKPPRLGAM
jgi:hypothetical protein